jgi:hypothetical protein
VELQCAHARVDDWVELPRELEDLHSGDDGITMQVMCSKKVQN